MSRHGDYDGPDDRESALAYGRFRGQVASAQYSHKGIQRLRALEAALVAMPRKRLIEGDLVNCEGDVCLVGVYARDVAGVDVQALQDKYTPEFESYNGARHREELDGERMGEIGEAIGITKALGWEWSYMNDEAFTGSETTPEARYEHALKWVREEIEYAEKRIARKSLAAAS